MPDPKSWNPWHGCTKYSEGCAHCYMYFLDEIHHVPERASEITRTGDFDKPLKKDRQGRYKIPAGYCLRVNMTSDTFLEEADEWREAMWDIIRQRPDLRFYLLTKRAPRIEACLPHDWGDGWENVSLNITCENQRAFDERWPILERIPAKHKGMNLAPLLGPIDIEPAVASGQIEHIDCAGEGYDGARPCHYEWMAAISEACERHRVNLAINSLGRRFVKNGKTYRLEAHGLSGEQAFYSELSRFYGNPKYRLYDPDDGHLLGEDALWQPHYAANKCATCTSMPTCVGCVDCGSCKNVRLVDRDEIERLTAEAAALHMLHAGR